MWTPGKYTGAKRNMEIVFPEVFLFWQVKGKEVKDEKCVMSLSEDGLTYTLKIKDVIVSDTGDYTIGIQDLHHATFHWTCRLEFHQLHPHKKTFSCVLFCCYALLCFVFPKRAVSSCFSRASISKETNFPLQTRWRWAVTAFLFPSPEIRGFLSFIAMLNNIIFPLSSKWRRMGSIINPPS